VNVRDTETIAYVNRLKADGRVAVDMVMEKLRQPNLSYYFNKIYDETVFNSPSTVVSMVGDDMIFESLDWDIAILQEINVHKGVGIVWCNDAYIAHENLCVNLFTTRHFVDATEKPFMCPLFTADMMDVVWMITAKETCTGHYLPEVIIRHDHGTAVTEDKWDENFCRLSPLRTLNSGARQQKKAAVYANIMAANLVKSGVATWSDNYSGYGVK